MQSEITELKRRVTQHDDLLPKIYEAINLSNIRGAEMNVLLADLKEARCKTPNACAEIILSTRVQREKDEKIIADLEKRVRFLEGCVKWIVGGYFVALAIAYCLWEWVKFKFGK